MEDTNRDMEMAKSVYGEEIKMAEQKNNTNDTKLTQKPKEKKKNEKHK